MLPIHSIREAILSALAGGNRLVLSAPTGSGKTTQVPQFLLAADYPSPQILVLQPRRLAARLVAERVARELNTRVGDLVGYQTRHDSRISGQTQIRFMTEGLFLRLMHSNPTLKDVGAVILDEFHERNLATDASVALVKLLQETSRPDLRMVVMSATLDTRLVSGYLSCPTLETHGRTFPVDVRYLDKRPTRRPVVGQWQRGPLEAPPWETAADALADLLDEAEKGDILIFMPGGYEIRRTIEQCQRLSTPQRPLSIFPLYSELPAADQDAALGPAPHRKVIVSTNVAETSITIEGVRHVIDSGLARVNRFDPKRGLNTLSVEPISQSAAEQRAGRAGRTAPGTATRLWLEREHRHRPVHETPEVRRLDLAEVLLQLKSFGVGDVARFPWLEPPDPAAVAHALELLTALGALAVNGELTDTGRTMARLPMHPRLSRMLLEAARRGCLERATLWAALISERDILLRGAKHEFADELPAEGPRSDFLVLEQAFAAARSLNFDPQRCAARSLNGLACREVDKTRRLYQDAARDARLAPSPHHPVAPSALGCALLAAYPDHLALLRNPSNLACVLVRGRRGQLDPDTVARRPGLVLPVEVREIGSGGSVRTVLSLVSEVELEWLYEVAAERIREETVTVFNAETQTAETIDRELLEDLVVSESARHTPDAAAAATVLAEKVLDGTLKLEAWDEAVEQWIARTRCVAEWFPERKLITYDEDDRRLIVEELCAGAVRYKDVRDKPVLPFVRGVLSWEDQRFIEQMAPERIGLPRGWRMPVDYTPGAAPRGRAKIQDFYDLRQTPTVAGGRVKVLLEILGPNFRPVQLTDDLAGFWQRLYPEIRKELSRRYPRHEWR